MIGSGAAVLRDHTVKARSNDSERPAYRALGPRRGARLQWKVEWTADPADAELLADAHHGVEHGRKKMRVLVCVEMGGRDAGVENLPHLSAKFIVNSKTARHCRSQKLTHCGWIIAAVEQRRSADQHQMTTDVESGKAARDEYGIVEGRAVRHQSGRCQDAAFVRLGDAGVDVLGEAEVVRVDDQLPQNRLSLILRNFFGSARKSLISS